MEKLFKLKANGTTVRTEILAGLTTFMTMAYIIALNPNLLTNFAVGTPLWNGVFLATCIASAIGTICMAFFANKPFVMAPGMGLNSFFAVVVANIVTLTGMSYLQSFQTALCIILIEGIVFIVLSFAVGMKFPLIFDKATWSYITFVYIFFAAVLPMWLLKQPRDYMTTFMFICMIAGAVVGLLVAHPTMNLPVFTGFNNEKLGTMFPILFVTVACGAVSGFHSLVSSGTSSKTVESEKDMLKVGYGAMVLESLLAVLALCVAGAAAAADGTPAAGTPFQIFSRGVAGFFEMFGVPVSIATVFMTMCVSALALTSLDAVARIGRMSFQELFSVDDMEHAEGWRKLFCNVYFSTFITLAFGFLLTQIGYANIWPLFGSANQLLSALVLATLCVFLKVTGRSNKMLFPPLIIMLCVTFTALVQRLIAMVKAISTAASVSIPAGETTWGAVFIANGLQLILAVLLIVLGLNIVFHSFSAYKKAEHNSEAKI